MPTVRRGSGLSSDERDLNSRGRVPAPRRRQIQQAAMAAKKKSSQRPKPNPNINEDKPTPILLKILSWLGIILLCFVLGYLGTSWAVEFLNKKLLLKPENRIENQEDLNNFNESEQERVFNETLNSSGSDIKQISLNIYHVKNDTIAETRQNFLEKIPEDNIREVVTSVINLSGMPQAEKIKLLHVFRVQDTAFLDMSGQFASSIESAGQRKSLLLLTSIVRTVQENFSPLSQVRFLIDSKPPKSGGVVDLSAPWKMPSKNS